MSPGAAPRGARAHLAVAATVGTLVLIPVFVWLLQSEPRLAGTNSVAPKGLVAGVEPGERLCVRDLRIPEGTAAVRLRAGADAPARVEVSLDPRGAQPVSGAADVAGTALRDVDFPLAADPATGPATLCVSAAGARITLAGVTGLETDGRAAVFLSGRPLPDRVSVKYLLKGERTLLSRLPDAARHASVFKAGFVGPWTFLALAIMLVLTWVTGLRRLAASARGERDFRLPAAALVALLAFANALTWSLVTPVHLGPDEYAHIAYANHLAETGHTPVEGSSAQFTSSEHVIALDATNAFAIHQVASGRPIWDPAVERAFEREARGAARDDGGGGEVTSVVHAPGYYAVAAGLSRVAGGSFWDRVLAMRLASILMAALTAAAVFGIVRELIPGHEWAATAAGLLVAFQPMFSFIGGVVNADMGANLAGAALLYLLVRAFRRGLEPWVGAALPAVLVWGVLAKAVVLAFAPVIALALGFLALRGQTSVRALSAVAASGVAVVLVWVAAAAALDRELLSLPETSASNGYSIAEAVSYVWQQFLPHLPGMTDLYNGRYHVPAFSLYGIQVWGAFGWLSVRFSDWVYFVIAGVVAVVAALAAVAAWRERAALRRRLPELAVLAMSFATVALLAHLAFVRRSIAPLISEQGRYLFPALAVPAVVAVGATFAAGRRHAPLVATGLVAALMVFCGACQLYAFAAWFA